MASAGTNDVSVAFAGLKRTLFELANAVFAADVLVSMREPLRSAVFERKLASAPPEGTMPSPSRAANASLPERNFHLSFAPERPCTQPATLVHHECTSLSGQTKRPAAMPSSDSEATVLWSLTCGPGTASLATTCHCVKRTDCADRAADVARNGEGLGDAERGNSECRLIVAPARRRKAALCSAIPCATPFQLSGKNETCFEE